MFRSPELYQIFKQHPVVITDSRKVQEGDLFFALEGENFNGDDFAEEAIKKGASYAVVSRSAKFNHPKLIRVENTLTALQDLARYHRQELGTKMLAITGSNGKTTTKELCKAVLEKKYRVLATSGNLNNHIGVPLTLLRLTSEIQFAVIEMGANHPGEIELLCNIALPDCGIITNVGKAHLEGFGSIEGVAKAKGELFDFLIQHNGIIFQNFNNQYIRNMVAPDYKNAIPYNNDHFYGSLISSDPFISLDIHLASAKITVDTHLVGKYNIENIIAAACAGSYFEVHPNEIKNAIESYTPQNNRSQLIHTERNKIVMDAYNANPSSMKCSIDNFMEIKGDRKVFILGQMLELGDNSAPEHKEILEYLKKIHADKVYLIGEAFEKLVADSAFRYFRTVNETIEELKSNRINSSLILIKGSRGNKLELVLPWL